MPRQQTNNAFDLISNALQFGQQGLLRGQQLKGQAQQTAFQQGQKEQQLESDLLRNQVLNQATEALTSQRTQQTERTSGLDDLNRQILESQLAQEQFKASPEFQTAELAKKRGTGKSTRRPPDVVGNVLQGFQGLETQFATGQRNFGLGLLDQPPQAPTAQDSLNVIQNALNFGATDLGSQQLDSVINILGSQGLIPAPPPTPGLPPAGKQEVALDNAKRLAQSTDEYKAAKTQDERDAIVNQIFNALNQRANNGNSPRSSQPDQR